MFIRCRNRLSGHEASIQVGLIQSGAMPDWKPLKGAKPSATPAEPTYNTTTTESGQSDNQNKEK